MLCTCDIYLNYAPWDAAMDILNLIALSFLNDKILKKVFMLKKSECIWLTFVTVITSVEKTKPLQKNLQFTYS